MLVRMWQNSKMTIFHVEIYFSNSSLLYSWQLSLYRCQNNLFLVNATCQLSNVFVFRVNLRAQFLYIKKDWWWARAWLRGSLGTDRRRNNMAADNFFIPNVEEFFASTLSIFSQCTACLGVRDGDQAELLSRRLDRTVWRNITCHVSTHNWIPGGGYMGHIGMCRCEGYGFQAVYSSIGYINQSVWV